MYTLQKIKNIELKNLHDLKEDICVLLPSPRAARQELQRLESAVGKSERLAGAVLADLRSMRQNPRATELRSEVGQGMSRLSPTPHASVCLVQKLVLHC